MKSIKQGSIMSLVTNIIIILFGFLWLFMRSEIKTSLEIIIDSILLIVECGIIISLNILYLSNKIPNKYLYLYGNLSLGLALITLIIPIFLQISNQACIYVLIIIVAIISIIGNIKININTRKYKNEIKTDNK